MKRTKIHQLTNRQLYATTKGHDLKTFETITYEDIDQLENGLALEGYVTATRRELAAKFGEPDMTGTVDNKVTTEWLLRFEDGTIATIYDWKRYEEAAGAPDLDEVYNWHIGGQTTAAVYAVSGALGTGADVA